MVYLPVVIEKDGDKEAAYDLYSRLLKDRIIFLGTGIDDHVANSVIAQLLFLESQDPNKDIFMYINSPGGSVTSGLGIYDTMQYIKPDINTVCIGQASSMGCFLLAAGTKGKRYALPHSRIMMHSVQAGIQGPSPDMSIQYKEVMRLQEQMFEILAEICGKKKKEIALEFERDRFMPPDEAKEYGLIDSIHYKSTRNSDD